MQKHCCSLRHVLFVLVKDELFEGQLNAVAASSWGADTARELNLELARLAKRPLNGPHLTVGCGHLDIVARK